jgi:hypothetical protein
MRDFGTPTRESRESRDKMAIWMPPPRQSQSEPHLRGGGATAPSVIREIEKVQGGEQAPRDGSLALPKDMVVKPFGPKGLLNV